MARGKWYVVIVGKAIGVFTSWLEVGPLVQGVPGALHQSFSTEEEARRMFEQEKAKGNTKIVGNEELPRSQQVQVSPMDIVAHPAASVLFRTNSEPSPVLSKSSAPSTPLDSSRSRAPFSPARSRSEHTVTTDWPVASTNRVGQPSARVQPASTASSASNHRPRVGVKAPPWLVSYPIAHNFPSAEKLALSPLNREDIPLSPLETPKMSPHRSPPNNVKTIDFYSHTSSRNPQQKVSTTSPRQVVAASTPQRSYASPNARTGPQEQALPNNHRHASQTSGKFGRPTLPQDHFHPDHVPHEVHEFMLELDPRSPVVKTGKAPITVNSLSFKRPSPEVRTLNSSMFVRQ